MSTSQRMVILFLAIMPFFPPIYGNMSKLSEKSHVEDFEVTTELFEALTSTPDDGFNYGWTVVTFPTVSNDVHEQEDVARNCTVLYLDQCTSWNKCRQTCHSIGAASYRWFHDGCCECVGRNCSNYGINDSRCSQCPEPGCEEDEDED